MQFIKDQENLNEKIILLRLDLNVPIKNGVITDQTRIDKILPIINFLIEKKAKILILSHVGRPKGKFVSFDHFAKEASPTEIVGYIQAIGNVCDLLNVSIDTGDGYRLIANSGEHGVQEVPHLHVHILGGSSCGRMIQS